MLGLEHEFILRAPDGAVVDARAVLPHVPGDRLDPGDRNAIRCRWGGAITCDGAEAEIATAPVEVAPGFTRVADAAARAATAELRALIDGATPDGFSTHVNVEVPSRLARRAAWLFTRRFAPAAMLMLDRVESPGIFVRPRPGRLEVCGEFAEGAQLRAATALITGAARACVEVIETQDGIVARMPPLAPFRAVPAHERFGWYVSARRAFGYPLYARGRAAPVGDDTAQAFLERAWTLARDFVPDHTDADAVVGGSLPLPCEDPLSPDPLPAAHPPNPYGAALARRVRGAIALEVHMQTWDLTVFRVSAPQRTFFVAVPAHDLAAFLGGLDGGRWDASLMRFAASAPSGATLRHWTQTGAVGVYDAVGDRRALLRPERDLDGDLVDPWAHLSIAPARSVLRTGDTYARGRWETSVVDPGDPSRRQPEFPSDSATTTPTEASGRMRVRWHPATQERPGKYPPPLVEPPPSTQPPPEGPPPSILPPPPGPSSWWPWPILPIVAVLVTLVTVITVITGGGDGVVTPDPSASVSEGPAECHPPFTEIAAAMALDCPLTVHEDPTDDGTWYEAAVEADPLPPDADIIGMKASMARISRDMARDLFGNTQFPCGREGERVVACGDRPFPAGRALVVAMQFAAPVPLEGEHFRIISVLLDGSPPRGGHTGSPGADQDLYLGADTTVDLLYVPIGRSAKTWGLSATDALSIGTGENLRQTGARAILQGDIAIFFFPGREFRSPRPRVRVLSQISDVSFGPQRGFASADVVPGRPSAEPSAMFLADAALAPTRPPPADAPS